MTDDERLVLEVDGDRAEFDLARGGRLASLAVGGHELLVGSEADPMRWGSYPMVPFAGRVRHGRFEFGGVGYELPTNLPPHAIHGTALDLPWRLAGEPDNPTMEVELGDPWPFPAHVEQRATMTAGHLTITMTVTALAEPMPAMLGWHPWFSRRVGDAEVELAFEAPSMYELDHEMIPTGRLVEPAPPPWDNTFVAPRLGPELRWPGVCSLRLGSDCRFWTVYTEPEHAICVEPQTEAPDVFNRPAELERSGAVIEEGGSMSATFELSWTLDPTTAQASEGAAEAHPQGGGQR